MDDGKKVKKDNEIAFLLFCVLLGAAAGVVFWLFLLLIDAGTWLVWEAAPKTITGSRFYAVPVCVIGGLITGLFRKKYGDYPDEMTDVLKKLKRDKAYPYDKMIILVVAALLPLIMGSSVGPEAGMVGIIAALGTWAGDNLKFASKRSEEYSALGTEVTLSVMFHSPLFGIFHAEEGEAGGESLLTKKKGYRVFVYCLASAAGFGVFYLLETYVMTVSPAFPYLSDISIKWQDLAMFIAYVASGAFLGLFFEKTDQLMEKVTEKIPPVISETMAGAALGVTACFIPMILFSGEDEMGELESDAAAYAPLFLIAIAFIKVIMTDLCIKSGLKGGHFFPLIFAAVSLGFGIALIVFRGDVAHTAFAAGVTAAATLGFSLKKPIAVSMLLLLCFPVWALLFIAPAAFLASEAGKLLEKRKETADGYEYDS